MSHHAYVMEGGQYPAILTLEPRRLALLDEMTARAINGDAGGTYAPVNPIIIGGNGLKLTTAASLLTGGVETRGPNTSIVADGAPEFTNASGVAAARTRTIRIPLRAAIYTNELAYEHVRGGLVTQQAAVDAYIPIPEIRAHHGARIASVELKFRIGNPHAGVPAVQPKLYVFRVDDDGDIALLKSTGGGFVQLAAANAVAYFASGQTQTLTYTCDQNNLPVEGTYTFVIQYVDESGANSLAVPQNVLLSAVVTIDNILTMAWP